MIQLVLYQPDIAQNFGAILRLSACLGVVVHVIEPCGFPLDAAKLKRAGMDYIHKAQYVRHVNWHAFLDYRQALDEAHCVGHAEPAGLEAKRREGSVSESTGSAPLGAKGVMPPSRLLLLETDGKIRYTDMAYVSSDYVVLGSESAGTPQALYAQMDATLTIPMRAGMRSLNVAMSAGMIVAEACRQMDWRF
ncbi:MAG: hypothetical protein K2X09_03710 [Rickettsiales bacterium]|nr:hypothetical protein [Rickettsiales bacterium]